MDIFEVFFSLIATVMGVFPAIVFFVVIITAIKKTEGLSNVKNTMNATHVSRDYTGITRAGKHQHKGQVGTTRKDEGWEETRCGEYKDEIFGRDTCNKYIKPDYDSLTCEDEDLSGN